MGGLELGSTHHRKGRTYHRKGTTESVLVLPIRLH